MAQGALADPILECGLLAGENIPVADCLRTQLHISDRAKIEAQEPALGTARQLDERGRLWRRRHGPRSATIWRDRDSLPARVVDERGNTSPCATTGSAGCAGRRTRPGTRRRTPTTGTAIWSRWRTPRRFPEPQRRSATEAGSATTPEDGWRRSPTRWATCSAAATTTGTYRRPSPRRSASAITTCTTCSACWSRRARGSVRPPRSGMAGSGTTSGG